MFFFQASLILAIQTGTNVISFFTSVIVNVRSKLECLSLAGFSNLILMFAGKVRWHFYSGLPERCFTLVGSSLTRKHYSWQEIPARHTLAYYEHS